MAIGVRKEQNVMALKRYDNNGYRSEEGTKCNGPQTVRQ